MRVWIKSITLNMLGRTHPLRLLNERDFQSRVTCDATTAAPPVVAAMATVVIPSPVEAVSQSLVPAPTEVIKIIDLLTISAASAISVHDFDSDAWETPDVSTKKVSLGNKALHVHPAVRTQRAKAKKSGLHYTGKYGRIVT